MQLTTISDVYSLAILIYAVYFLKEPWPVVSVQLLSAVQSGHRPAILDSAPQCIVQLLQKCWRIKSLERPSISEISQQLEGHLEVITSNKESGLTNQDTHTDECFDVPSMDKFNSSVIDDNPNNPENSEFYLKIDACLGSSQNSFINEQIKIFSNS